MTSFKAKLPVVKELFAKNHRGPFAPPPSGSRVNRDHQRSMTFDDVIYHFRVFVSPEVIWGLGTGASGKF